MHPLPALATPEEWVLIMELASVGSESFEGAVRGAQSPVSVDNMYQYITRWTLSIISVLSGD